MPNGDDLPNASESSTGADTSQNVCSSPPEASTSEGGFTPADGGQSSSGSDVPVGPPPPPGSDPQPSTDSTANQSVPEQNYTPAEPSGGVCAQPDAPPPAPDTAAQENACTPEDGGNSSGGTGGIVATSAAPLLAPDPVPQAPPLSGDPANDNFLSGEPANDNAVPEEGVPEAEGVEGLEGAEALEGAEVGEGLAEGGALLGGEEIVAAVLAPEVVIPLALIGLLLLSGDDDPKGADAASEQQPDENTDTPVLPCEQYKPVIAGQEYSDQTCTDAQREEITERIKAAKDKLKDIGSAQVPKTPYNEQLANATDDKTRQKIIRKQQVLCQKLNDMLEGQKELLKLRNEMQEECFKSPKTTEDEKERDEGHKEQVEGLTKSLQNLLDQIAKNCP